MFERSLKTRLAIGLILVVLGVAVVPIGASAQGRPIEPVPEGADNAIFYFNQRFIPQVAQSYTLSTPFTLGSVSFYPRAVTQITPAYFTTPQEARHTLERFVTEYPLVSTDAVLTVWRSSTTGDLGTMFDLGSGFTKVATVSTTFNLRVGSANTITLGNTVVLSPGTYVVVLGMRFADPTILTLHLAGRESGNNTRGGTRQEFESDCNYTRSQDLYTSGRAYQGRGVLPFTDSWDNYVGFGSLFVEHQAKIQECIAIGRFDTPFNPGDLKIDLNPPGYQPGRESSQRKGSTSKAPNPPMIGSLKPTAAGVIASVKSRKDLVGAVHVVLAFPTGRSSQVVSRCVIPEGGRSCVLQGLRRKTTYFVTAGVQFNGADFLSPNRKSVRTR